MFLKWAGIQNLETNQRLKMVTATGEECIALVGGSDLHKYFNKLMRTGLHVKWALS